MNTLEKISKQFDNPIGRKMSNFFTFKEWMKQHQRVMQRLWEDMDTQQSKEGKYSIRLSGMDMLYTFEAIGYAIDLIQAILNISEEEQNA